MSQIVAVITLTTASAACITDVRSHRIPNALTFGAAFAALTFHVFVAGWSGAQTATLGWMAGTAFFLPFFLLGGMGAGDVKLLAALGAWLGPTDALWLGIYASIAGGGLAVIVALTRGYLAAAMRNLSTLVSTWFLTGLRPVPAMTLARGEGPRLAYALPIFAGTAVTLWMR
jgi:prepilin peptidase CpaA